MHDAYLNYKIMYLVIVKAHHKNKIFPSSDGNRKGLHDRLHCIE